MNKANAINKKKQLTMQSLNQILAKKCYNLNATQMAIMVKVLEALELNEVAEVVTDNAMCNCSESEFAGELNDTEVALSTALRCIKESMAEAEVDDDAYAPTPAYLVI